jgi:hypothetical protein
MIVNSQRSDPDSLEAAGNHNGQAMSTEPVVDALRRKIAILQEQQKDAIQRLSMQRISMQDVGLELARLEDELATAQKLLENRLDTEHFIRAR